MSNKFIIFLIITLFSSKGYSMPNELLEHYVSKFFINQNTTYSILPTDLYVDKTAKNITLSDSDKKVKWEYSFVETITHNTHFQYDYYHISTGTLNIRRIVINKRVEVKHNGVFYYRIVIGDKTYLATKNLNHYH